jgi:peptidylprolyl isomerase/peptidyl-prolyl cis-trans isomerase B (cyclophilin B)
MTRTRFLATAIAVLGTLALIVAPAPRIDGKKVTTPAGEAQPADPKAADPKTADPKASDAKKGTPRVKQSAIITMDKGGEITIDFYPADAPKTVENFVTLAKKGFYDGLAFHRVEPGFVAQGGDPKGNGTGGPGYQIKAEFNKQKHVRGTVAMARSQSPDSAGSQFYICFKPAPFLDGNYTVFGIVTSGMEVVDGIKIGDKMKSVKIVEAAQ